MKGNFSAQIPGETLRCKIADQLDLWRVSGPPSRGQFESAARRLNDWKRENHIDSIWNRRPKMATATLDDGWGNGLQLIRMFAEVAGLEVIEIGLMKTADRIIEVCRREEPDMLGMTILQFDSEDQLSIICSQVSAKTRVVVGGPVFSADPDLAERTGVDFVAKNAAAFWEYLLRADL